MSLPAPWTILFGAEPLALPLACSASEAVARLRRVVHPTFLHTMNGAGLVGRVSEDRVAVRFQRPRLHNSFAPYFVGHFGVEAGRPRLAGTLRLSRLAQVWFGVWFGGLLGFTLILLVGLALGVAEPGAASGLLILLVMWVGGLGLLYFGWWLARRERKEIHSRLQEALSRVAA